jgi:hypothetical protein
MNNDNVTLVISLVSLGISIIAIAVTLREHFDQRSRRRAKVEVTVCKLSEDAAGGAGPEHFANPDLEWRWSGPRVPTEVNVRNTGKGTARNITIDLVYPGSDPVRLLDQGEPFIPNGSLAKVPLLVFLPIDGELTVAWDDDDGHHGPKTQTFTCGWEDYCVNESLIDRPIPATRPTLAGQRQRRSASEMDCKWPS